MTKKVYLNPDRLDTAINSLTYLADDAETAKTNIDNQFSAEGDPMDPSTDLFTIRENHRPEHHARQTRRRWRPRR